MRRYDINYFLENEKAGVRYCKVGKSKNCNYIKGSNFPYYQYLEKLVDFSNSTGQITFEDVHIVLNYLHYGDQLVILNFTKGFELMQNFECFENSLNKGCYDSNQVFVDRVINFSNPESIRFILDNIIDFNRFENIGIVAIERLKSAGYNASANLLSEWLYGVRHWGVI